MSPERLAAFRCRVKSAARSSPLPAKTAAVSQVKSGASAAALQPHADRRRFYRLRPVHLPRRLLGQADEPILSISHRPGRFPPRMSPWRCSGWNQTASAARLEPAAATHDEVVKVAGLSYQEGKSKFVFGAFAATWTPQRCCIDCSLVRLYARFNVRCTSSELSVGHSLRPSFSTAPSSPGSRRSGSKRRWC